MNAVDFGREARQLRVGTLVRLRWIAAAGQIAALLVTRYALHIGFPLNQAALCVAMLLAFNMFLRLRFAPAKRLEERPTTLILAFDIGQLGLMLHLTGGLANPFAVLLIAPTMISAVSQSLGGDRQAARLRDLLAPARCAFWRVPLTIAQRRPGRSAADRDAARWSPSSSAPCSSPIYGGQVAKEARQLGEALAATELILARAQHLSQLDGLAAAAAHELGTPLATLTVVVHELANQREVAALAGEDLALAKQELKRCRTILGQLSLATRDGGEPFDRSNWRRCWKRSPGRTGCRTSTSSSRANGPEPRPVCPRNPALLYGLRNLVENAWPSPRRRLASRRPGAATSVEIAISRRRTRGFRRRCCNASASPTSPTAAPARRAEPEAAASASGCSSPRRCSSAPARNCASATCRSAARGAAVIRGPVALFASAKRLSLPAGGRSA